ncbi:MAG: ATP-binding protein [Bacteroidota bacterium]|jgi:hypothetical protein
MDSLRNPFSPGAGSPPYELAGRDAVVNDVMTAIRRTALGRSSKHMVLMGLRGVGKTVLLGEIRRRAESEGQVVVLIEAPEDRSLPALLSPLLRLALLKISRTEAARELAYRGLRVLAGFVSATKVKYSDIEVTLDLEPEQGTADIGDLEHDLADVIEAVGEAAKGSGKALVIMIDELQYLPASQLGPLVAALHRCSQNQLPVTLVGAGLPNIRGHLGNSKTYAERLFDFRSISTLTADATRDAVIKPLAAEGVGITTDALDRIVSDTHGYPYFIQEFGKHAWDVAEQTPVTLQDVEVAREFAEATLDASFFGVRFDRVSTSEREYLRAMAELGPGPHQSADIAIAMGKSLQAVASIRSRLIQKGMLWSPSHGEVAFTVPMFDEYLRRIMK